MLSKRLDELRFDLLHLVVVDHERAGELLELDGDRLLIELEEFNLELDLSEVFQEPASDPVFIIVKGDVVAGLILSEHTEKELEEILLIALDEVEVESSTDFVELVELPFVINLREALIKQHVLGRQIQLFQYQGVKAPELLHRLIRIFALQAQGLLCGLILLLLDLL